MRAERWQGAGNVYLLVEEVPADVAVERYVARDRGCPHLPPDEQTLRRIRMAVAHPEPLEAPRTVVVDTTRRVAIA